MYRRGSISAGFVLLHPSTHLYCPLKPPRHTNLNQINEKDRDLLHSSWHHTCQASHTALATHGAQQYPVCLATLI